MSGFGWFLLFISPLLLAMFACLCGIAFAIINLMLLEAREMLRWWRHD